MDLADYWRRTITEVTKMYDPFEELANEIIILAAEDIRKGNKYAEDAKRFLKSEWCSVLTKVDGRTILRRLESEKGGKVK